jgi:hypothetical protein
MDQRIALRIALEGFADGAALATGATAPTAMTDNMVAAMTVLVRIRILLI